MALTHQLKKDSPVRQFIHASAPDLLLAGSRGHLGKEVARQFCFDRLIAHELRIPVPEQVKSKQAHSAPVGTAFDYRARMMLGSFAPQKTVAITGLSAFQGDTSRIRNGKKMAQVLTEAFERTNQKIAGDDEDEKDKAALVLGWCESIYRVGTSRIMDGSIGRVLRKVARTGEDLYEALDPLQLADLKALRIGAVPQVEAWQAEIITGARFELNPEFQGSSWVGGADADWMVGATLFECKTTEQHTNPWIRQTLFQLLGYTLLDFEDKLEIRQLGIWLPRRQACQTWNLDQILGSPAEEALIRLREDFQEALKAWHQQLAVEAQQRRDAWKAWEAEFEAAQKARQEAEEA